MVEVIIHIVILDRVEVDEIDVLSLAIWTFPGTVAHFTALEAGITDAPWWVVADRVSSSLPLPSGIAVPSPIRCPRSFYVHWDDLIIHGLRGIGGVESGALGAVGLLEEQVSARGLPLRLKEVALSEGIVLRTP